MDNKEFLKRRRDRMIATILGFKEREVDKYLPEQVQNALRKELLDQINHFCDTTFDVLTSDSGVNEMFLERLDDIYNAVMDSRGITHLYTYKSGYEDKDE